MSSLTSSGSLMFAFAAMLLGAAFAQSNTAPTPGQPSRNDAPLGGFEIVEIGRAHV